ncbi:DUF2207 domain-containing protein [Pseudoxanthomonas sacheonensis]|uniref:Membrane protein YgcG n=1 Tax=Pseudoxanthomonas sacheonensis TaxID=443615 RepID=A0ABU1RUP7_9GAMM|nr:DUF2207 domain-containing protein [Pseudoxanthomonas sacheonensis]MDR6842500.1 putative membrane protein YgcG [Pseudoxanthomonas sacheonensis]
MKRIFFALLLLLAAPLAAQERILSYDSEVQVGTDGSLDVTERIAVRAEGNNIRRGIYRDFPTRYKDRYGNRVVVDLQVIDVQRDGKPEPWFTEKKSNGVRINTGNDDFLPTPADFVYTLRYRTTRQLGFFADHDELYWNAIGTGWEFPIERGSVEVRLPSPVPMDRIQVEAYTGAQGQKGDAYDAKVTAPGIARWLLTQPLAPREGFTIVMSFPKGLVAQASSMQRWMWLLKDNRGVLIALAALIALLVFCFRRWHRLGRDPKPGVIIVQYDPPPGYSPAGLRFMQRMAYDTRCFSADLLSLAVAGNVRIHREKGFLSDDWELEKTADAAPAGIEEQRILQSHLFKNGNQKLELKNTNASTVSGAQSAHSAALEKRFKPALFARNGGSIAIAAVIALVGAAASLALSGGGGIPFILIVVGLMLIGVVVFGVLIKAPTLAGRKLLDEIEGLKRYLSVAERDELKNIPGPDAPPALDAKRYEMLLPYAVALEVEDAWTRKFTVAAGAAAVAAATAGISWYHGSNIGDLGSFTKAVGSSLSSQIASSSSVPGSSSGGGGGGSSGGGGGGGGGGGR